MIWIELPINMLIIRGFGWALLLFISFIPQNLSLHLFQLMVNKQFWNYKADEQETRGVE